MAAACRRSPNTATPQSSKHSQVRYGSNSVIRNYRLNVRFGPLCGLKSESSRGQVATPRGSRCLLTTVAPRGLLLGHAAHVFDREIISGGNYAESHRRSDRAHDIDRGVAQTPPPAPIMPPSLPAAHVVSLMTNEGSGAFGVQWRVADVRIVEVPAAINKDRYKTTYQIEPRAMPT